MDISKSIELCIKRESMSKGELAKRLGIAPQTVSVLAKSKHCSPAMLGKLGGVFDMKISEFIALGE